MDIQKKFWNLMVQIKASVFYLDEYAERSYKSERLINVFTAIASSGSIAGWVVWNGYGILWSVVIAASQVISAVKSYLPFSKRLEIIKPLENDMQLLFVEADYNWFKIRNGELTADEINELIKKLSQTYTRMEIKHLTSYDLLENRKIKAVADDRTNTYFSTYYGGMHDEE